MNKVTIEITSDKYTVSVWIGGELLSERSMIMDTDYSMKDEKVGDIFEDLVKDGFYGLNKLAEAIDDCDLLIFEIVQALQDTE